MENLPGSNLPPDRSDQSFREMLFKTALVEESAVLANLLGVSPEQYIARREKELEKARELGFISPKFE